MGSSIPPPRISRLVAQGRMPGRPCRACHSVQDRNPPTASIPTIWGEQGVVAAPRCPQLVSGAYLCTPCSQARELQGPPLRCTRALRGGMHSLQRSRNWGCRAVASLNNLAWDSSVCTGYPRTRLRALERTPKVCTRRRWIGCDALMIPFASRGMEVCRSRGSAFAWLYFQGCGGVAFHGCDGFRQRVRPHPQGSPGPLVFRRVPGHRWHTA